MKNLKPAVNITALVLAAGLLIGLLTGCKPKIDPKYNYKVEHLQQNIADDDYTLCATEILSGKDGETTSAAAKPYAGFTVQSFNQAAINADGSTVIQIKYNRNIITLKLDLDGGNTETPLTDGEAGTKLLKGKFGAKVELKKLRKGSDVLDVWEPELPSTFPALPAETYTASWTDKYRITVTGDERINIPLDSIKIDPTPDKTWNNIKTQIEGDVSLKPEWQGGDYKIYEWRLGGETGEKISDDYPIDKHLTVYAVTNYAKFNIDGTKIKLTDGKGYTGDKPKGKIIIPDEITEIEDGSEWDKGAFKDCTEISSIKFPQALTKIGESAFSGCTGLTSIHLPANLTTIGWSAFYGCKGLTSLDLSGCTSLTKIGFGAFYDCIGLTSISLPASLTTIDSHAFFGCTGLTSLDLSNCTNLTIIGQQVFNNCTNLTSISLPANLTTIGMGAFDGCTGLTSLDLSGCTSLTTIGESAFRDCTSLTSLDLSGCTSLTTIDYSAFKDCTGLTEVKLPANLTQIVARAFVGCTGLKSAVFADKNGWKVYGHGHSSTVTPINSSDLANKETAAKYLSKNVSDGGYCDLYWYKN
nr:leucine-rich repeat domain-containing protein [uncultured Treponema sp.]